MTTLYTCLIQREGKPTLIVIATSEEQLAKKLEDAMSHTLYEEDFESLIENEYLHYQPHSYTHNLAPYILVLDTVEL